VQQRFAVHGAEIRELSDVSIVRLHADIDVLTLRSAQAIVAARPGAKAGAVTDNGRTGHRILSVE